MASLEDVVQDLLAEKFSIKTKDKQKTNKILN